MTEFHQLIQKWLDGSYTATDERAMRKLIERDSDAREALEGYLLHPQLQHTDGLQRLLDHMPKAKPQQPFYIAYGKYLSAAAAVALLISAWWYLQPDQNPQLQQPEIAAVEIPTPQPNSTIEAPQPNTHTTVAAAETAKTINPTPKPSAPASKPSAAPTAQIPDTQADVAVVASESAPAMSAPQGKEATEPLRDEIAVMESAPPAAPAAVKSKAAKQREESVKFDTDKKASTQPVTTFAQPEPEKGWSAFELYLRDALVYPKEAADRRLTGSVRLNFSIDEQGRPNQIRVTRSLCLTCDVEAIRVLTEGPKWQPTGQKNVSVEIRFPR